MSRASEKVTKTVLPLRLYLFGSLRVEHGARTVHFRTRKIESLLAYLVLHPGSHPREKLAALFWGDSSDASAKHSLRTALTALRGALGEALILADRDTVQIDPEFPTWVDALEFQRTVDENAESAISLYSGDLLADLYDDWILLERERLRSLSLDALLRLAQHARSRSEYARAMQWAQRVLAGDSTNEKAYQHLMFCSAALGDRTGALQYYDECANKLHDELGVQPSQETTDLREQIEQQWLGGPSREALFTNLPNPLTGFIGRTREIAEVKQLLTTHRLVTITGSGGCGKTRLAIEVAHRLVETFPNGVWWVELAPLSDASLVPHAIAQSLGLLEAQHESPEEFLVHFLREKQALLVLDNCEHLIGACARLAGQLLSACAGLKVLATSREALGLIGEAAWRVPSLAAPDPEHLPPLEQVAGYEAIRLFAQRAAALIPAWNLIDNLLPVAHICARLDGIPLAIELAAARLNALSAAQIAERLDDRFDLLTTGSRTAWPRQQTLRATIDWSYDLLSDEERTLFRQLAVFAGGWTLEAAEFVCGMDVAAPMTVANGATAVLHSHTSTLDLLSRLIAKSLVLADEQNGQARYHMLETIRQYARDKLEGAGEHAAVQNRHLEFFLKLAEEAEPHLLSAGALAWLSHLDADYDNLRTALEWTQIIADQRSRLRLASALGWFWRNCNHAYEGSRCLASALEQDVYTSAETGHNRALRARALLTAGIVGWGIQDLSQVRARLEESIALCDEIGDQRGVAHALAILGSQVGDVGGEFVSARSYMEKGVTLLRTLLRENQADVQSHVAGASRWQAEDQWWLAFTLSRLGEVTHHHDLAGAHPVLEEGLALAHQLGDEWLVGQTLLSLGSVETKQGDRAAGRTRFEEALVLLRQIGFKRYIGWALGSLGDIARYEEDYPQANRFYAEGLTMYTEAGIPSGTSWMLYSQGCVALHDRESQRAAELFAESLVLRKEIDHREGIAEVLDGLAGVAAVNHQPERAARLFGAAQAVRETMKDVIRSLYRAPSDLYLPMARSQLDDAAFKAAWDAGHAMPREQAIEYALHF